MCSIFGLYSMTFLMVHTKWLRSCSKKYLTWWVLQYSPCRENLVRQLASISCLEYMTVHVALKMKGCSLIPDPTLLLYCHTCHTLSYIVISCTSSYYIHIVCAYIMEVFDNHMKCTNQISDRRTGRWTQLIATRMHKCSLVPKLMAWEWGQHKWGNN